MTEPIIVTNLEMFVSNEVWNTISVIVHKVNRDILQKVFDPPLFFGGGGGGCIILFSPQLSANCNTEFHIKPLVLRDIIKNPFTQFLYLLYTHGDPAQGSHDN